MGEILVQLSPPLYQQLVGRAADEEREPADAIVEAVRYWLREEEEPPSEEERFRRALERTGLWTPPEERQYAVRRPVDREALMRKLEGLQLDLPLSEDIIADRR